MFKAPYDHMTDRVEVKKNIRDADGHVIISPRNFVTNPPKKGKTGKRTTFESFPGHVPDDYNNPKKLLTEELEYHKKHLQEKPFSY